MFQVEKRDGTIAEFQMKKITDAIGKAFGAKDMQFSDDMLQMLALRVTADFQSKIKDGKISVEAIQDSVENVLIQCGYAEVAKAYILYRKQREKIRNMKSTIVDYKEIVDSYVKVEDWRVKENSTVTYSVGGLILSNSGAITANYWLSEIYDDEIAEAHRNADIHIHDLSMLTGYCAGWSLKQLIKEGLGGINGKITSSPARHLSVLCNQMVNFLQAQFNKPSAAEQDAAALKQLQQKTYTPQNRTKDNGRVVVEGVGNLMHHIARCCQPIPGDEIVGFITQGRGISVHRADCDQLAELQSHAPERIVDAVWGESYSAGYSLVVRVEANDRSGLLRDITTILANEKVNVLGVASRSDTRQQLATIDMTIEIYNLQVLGRVLGKLNQVPDVIDARRLHGG